MRVKEIAAVVDRWIRNVRAAAPDYQAGLQNPRKPWMAATLEAVSSWAAGIQAAITGDLFAKGVRAAGETKWLNNALSKGVQRWAPGVEAAQDDYRNAVAPYLATLSALTLPKRYARGDNRNYDRVITIGKALFNKRTAKSA